MSQLYDSMAEGTLLVVMCQGAMSPMVGLMSRKTKSKWDSNKKEPEITVGEKRGRSQSKSWWWFPRIFFNSVRDIYICVRTVFFCINMKKWGTCIPIYDMLCTWYEILKTDE